ncbi:MAG: HTTM domain-containing protein [Saprospiraceae bacterium]|nr:HTTM domain-containing protein [Saprospiraceae bacterium]
MTYINKFKNWLSEPINGYIIGLFRVIFGLFMTYEIANYLFTGMVNAFFVSPKLNFPYEGLEWLKPLPAPALTGVLYVMLVCAFLITFGLLMKWSARLFAVLYLYMFLLDKSLYNNHIYLFILLAVLLSFTNADQFLSLRKRKLPGITVPRWQQFMLAAQVMCVYFFASLIKMRTDWWVLKQPVRMISEAMPADGFLASFYKSELGINTMVYLGFSLDFFAPLLLWYKPLRKWAIIPFALFHYSNSRIFGDIGIFPFLMMAALILYFEMEELPLLRRWFPKVTQKNTALAQPIIGKWTLGFLVAYFVFQLLFPLRGLFLPNDLDYTTIGNRFSWRVKADARTVSEFEFILKDPVSGQEGEINYRGMINNVQIQAMLYDPRMIRSFAHWIHEQGGKNGLPNAEVYAKIKFSLNGRPPQYFVNQDMDMAKVGYSPYEKLDWVLLVEK